MSVNCIFSEDLFCSVKAMPAVVTDQSVIASGVLPCQYALLWLSEISPPKLGNQPITPATTSAITIITARMIRYSVVPCPFAFNIWYTSFFLISLSGICCVFSFLILLYFEFCIFLILRHLQGSLKGL